MKKIGLTQRVEAGRERRDCLDLAWYGLLAQLDCRPVPLPNLSQPENRAGLMLEELGLMGIILTGGNDIGGVTGGQSTAPERDLFEGALLDACAERQVPVLGVCRGLQMLVAHHGGKLRAVAGHVAKRHPLVVSPDCTLPLTDREVVNSFHDFGVHLDDMPEALKVAATAPDGTVEAVAHIELPQWGIMWHPERAPNDRRDMQVLRELFA